MKYTGAIYGLMIVGWSLGGLIGPPIIAALIGSDKNYTAGYTVIGIIALVALALPVITKMPRPKDSEEASASAISDRGAEAAS